MYLRNNNIMHTVLHVFSQFSACVIHDSARLSNLGYAPSQLTIKFPSVMMNRNATMQ